MRSCTQWIRLARVHRKVHGGVHTRNVQQRRNRVHALPIAPDAPLRSSSAVGAPCVSAFSLARQMRPPFSAVAWIGAERSGNVESPREPLPKNAGTTARCLFAAGVNHLRERRVRRRHCLRECVHVVSAGAAEKNWPLEQTFLLEAWMAGVQGSRRQRLGTTRHVGTLGIKCGAVLTHFQVHGITHTTAGRALRTSAAAVVKTAAQQWCGTAPCELGEAGARRRR